MTDQTKFVRVPTEPTDDMIKAGLEVKWRPEDKWGPRVVDIYKAMVAAAPPQEEADDLVKRLMISEEGWYDQNAPGTPIESRNSVMRDAANFIKASTP